MFNRLRINVIANFIGLAWSSVMGIIFVPSYIQLMGVESYGLVGLYASLQAMLQVLDLGLSPTLNREMARYSAKSNEMDEARDLLRTLEIGYWAIGIGIGIILVQFAPLLATQWIRSERLSTELVTQAVISMGILFACQWPLSLYNGGLLGLQKQVTLNLLNIIFSTLNNVGALLILLFVSPNIAFFFTWQIVTNILRVVTVSLSLWLNLGASVRSPKIRPALLRNVWKFAAGLGALSVTSAILMQADKVILSRVLGLQAVGYYTLAGTVASAVLMVATPVFNAVFPNFSALVANEKGDELRRLYHRSSQILATLTAPLAAVLATFSFTVLFVWTNNSETARIVAPIASLLVIGNGLRGIVHMPYALHLAYGMTKPSIVFNCCALALLVPLLIIMSSSFGTVGAATVWMILNLAYLFLYAPITHILFMPKQTRHWFFDDVAPPLLASLAITLFAKWIVLLPESRWLQGLEIIMIFGITFLFSALVLGSTRNWLQTQIAKFKQQPVH